MKRQMLWRGADSIKYRAYGSVRMLQACTGRFCGRKIGGAQVVIGGALGTIGGARAPPKRYKVPPRIIDPLNLFPLSTVT